MPIYVDKENAAKFLKYAEEIRDEARNNLVADQLKLVVAQLKFINDGML